MTSEDTAFKRTILFLATGGCIGNIPVMPGTFGSLWGIPIAVLLSRLDFWLGFGIILFFTLFAIWISGEAEKILTRKDPGCIVVDEIAGMMVALVGISPTPFSLICGFALFRLFDIIKPFPIRNIERTAKGGFGIVIDDIIAGIMAHVSLRIILMFIPAGSV